MANILIITKRFPPESPATAVLGEELATFLAHAGHQVTVLAGYPHHPFGRLIQGYRLKLIDLEKKNGYRLIRTGHLIHPSSATVIRLLIMLSQCLGSFLGLRYIRRPDIVISFDGYPLLGPLTAALIARIFGAKLISVIYDIYPDIAIEMGKLSNPGLVALSYKLEKLIYHYSDRIIVLSDGFQRNLSTKKKVGPEKIEVIPVWLDAQEITPMGRENLWRQEQNILPEKFVVLYAGTIGLISGAVSIVQAAQFLESYKDILILLVGDGYGKDEVLVKARSLGLQNIKFLPFQPRQRLKEIQATADVSLVTLAPGRGRTSVPSKVLPYMAAARPVIASVDEDCDTANLIRQARCGLVVPPGDGAALAEAIITYYHDAKLRQQHGCQGRNYFLENFEKQKVLQKYLDLIDQLVPFGR